MTAPTPQPVQYALTSVYTDPYLGGTDGPWLLTADPATAAHFFLTTDRPGHLEVMVHATADDGVLLPARPDDIVHRALAELPPADPRRDTLRTAQADWLEDRLWDRQDEPSGAAPGGPDWTRAGTAWGAVFTTLPSADVLAELAGHYPGAQEPHVPLVMTALRTARAIRQAAGAVGEEDRQLLVANWRILNSSWPACEEPAARAAATWYLERLADLDPITAQPPAGLTDDQRARWREGAVVLQRDLLVLNPALHPDRVEAFTARVHTEPADPAPDSAARTEEASDGTGAERRRLDAALAGALEHLPLDGEMRERVRTAAAAVLQRPQALPLPGQPAADADAALHWRRRVPSAQRAAQDTDATLTHAYTYVARARREAGEDRRSSADQGSTAPARTLAAETAGRHAVLGRLLALADAERAARAHEPHLHAVAGAAARAARTQAQARASRPMEVHYTEQAVHTATFDAARSLLDEASPSSAARCAAPSPRTSPAPATASPTSSPPAPTSRPSPARRTPPTSWAANWTTSSPGTATRAHACGPPPGRSTRHARAPTPPASASTTSSAWSDPPPWRH